MFCENCGARVEDGQPFCPNCGNRMSAAAPAAASGSAPAYQAPAAARPVKAPVAVGGLLGKFNAMQGLEKIFFACTCGLWIVCFILSQFKVLSAYISAPLAYAAPFFTMVINVLFTLAITFLVLDYFDKFSFKWLWWFLAGAAAVIFLVFIFIWIDSEAKLSAGGWFFLILQAGLTATSILLLLEKLKK